MKKINFSDKFGLTQAVLSGRKTMTRRIVPQSTIDKYALLEGNTIIDDARYVVGEVVAIAQSYESIYNEQGLETMDMFVSGLKNHKGWRNKLFVAADKMPYHIRITGVRVERLRDISDEDCIKEGIDNLPYSGNTDLKPFAFYDTYIKTEDGKGWYRSYDTPREAYAALIDRISGKGVWNSNPYVFVYDFELVD